MVGDILQPTHLLFIFLVALLVLGPKRLPEVGRTLGSGIRDFRQAINGESTHEHQHSAQATQTPVSVAPVEHAPVSSTPVAAPAAEAVATAAVPAEAPALRLSAIPIGEADLGREVSVGTAVPSDSED